MELTLTQKYEFRDIRPEETEEAIEIEQICFPPNEACLPKSMRERIEKAPELFLVAIDRENGKIAGFKWHCHQRTTVPRRIFYRYYTS